MPTRAWPRGAFTAAPGEGRAGSGRGSSESWPELPLRQCREVARADGRIAAALLCPPERETRDPPGAPGVSMPSSHTTASALARRRGPPHALLARQGAGSGKVFLQASLGSANPGAGPSAASWPPAEARPGAALRLRPLSRLGRSASTAAHLEGPVGSQGEGTSIWGPTCET